MGLRLVLEKLAAPKQQVHSVLPSVVADDWILADEPYRAPVPNLRSGFRECLVDFSLKFVADCARCCRLGPGIGGDWVARIG